MNIREVIMPTMATPEANTPSSDDFIGDALAGTRAAAGTSPEAVLALASLDVEESADNARQARQVDRQASSRSRRHAIAARRDAALLKAVGQVVGAAGTVAGASGSREGEALADAYQALLTVAVSGLDAAAATHDLQADEAKARAQDSADYAGALQGHQDKLLSATESIARLRHEANMASLRG